MTDDTIALFSYEHRHFPDYDPRQEFSRLCGARNMKVRTVPLAEHHSRYCAEDIEIWEVLRISSNVTSCPWFNRTEPLSIIEIYSWGETFDKVNLSINASRLNIHQDSSIGIGGMLWPSSVVCSR